MRDSTRRGPEPRLALTREISTRLAECELTHLERRPIDLELARAQHRGYEEALRSFGLEVVRVDPAPEHPDSVFVEDTAVVLDEIAVLTRPGAASRRGEVEGVAQALDGRRPLARIEPPATLDGGDVLVVGRRVFVGRSERTDAHGIAQLAELAERHGYTTKAVQVKGCLHLKSAVTSLGERTLLANPDWVDTRELEGFEIVEIDPGEPAAANVLRLGQNVIVPAEHPRTASRLAARGVSIHPVPAGELAKAEGGVTCCSLIL